MVGYREAAGVRRIELEVVPAVGECATAGILAVRAEHRGGIGGKEGVGKRHRAAREDEDTAAEVPTVAGEGTVLHRYRVEVVGGNDAATARGVPGEGAV